MQWRCCVNSCDAVFLGNNSKKETLNLFSIGEFFPSICNLWLVEAVGADSQMQWADCLYLRQRAGRAPPGVHVDGVSLLSRLTGRAFLEF